MSLRPIQSIWIQQLGDLRGPSWQVGVAEEARTRSFASLAFAGFAFVVVTL